MKRSIVYMLATLLMLTGCIQAGDMGMFPLDGDGMERLPYLQIDQHQARRMMEADDGHVIVDVRRQDEYDAGHIPGAICIPNESIGIEPPEELPDRSQVILIYCRSGNRSKQAAEKLETIDWDEAANAVQPVPTLVISANGKVLYAHPEDNASAQALIEMLSSEAIEVEMHDYGHFEKVGPLPWSLPRTDETITTEPGDVILYQGNQITIYYDQNTWDFTRLARIEDVTREELLSAFGEGDVKVILWIEWSE